MISVQGWLIKIIFCYSGIWHLFICVEDGSFSIVEETCDLVVYSGHEAKSLEGIIRRRGDCCCTKFGFFEKRSRWQFYGYVPLYPCPWQKKARSQSRHWVKSRKYQPFWPNKTNPNLTINLRIFKIYFFSFLLIKLSTL